MNARNGSQSFAGLRSKARTASKPRQAARTRRRCEKIVAGRASTKEYNHVWASASPIHAFAVGKKEPFIIRCQILEWLVSKKHGRKTFSPRVNSYGIKSRRTGGGWSGGVGRIITFPHLHCLFKNSLGTLGILLVLQALPLSLLGQLPQDVVAQSLQLQLLIVDLLMLHHNPGSENSDGVLNVVAKRRLRSSSLYLETLIATRYRGDRFVHNEQWFEY